MTVKSYCKPSVVAEVLVAQMQALLIQAEVAVVAQEVLVLPLVVQPLVTAANLATTHLTHKVIL